jgi:N-acetylmuramoyl-L-alanine amidase
LPAQANRLLFWRFESGNNRLVFTTDDRVQPTAQLIPNPTRVVIDLPGIILGRPSVTQSIGGTIQNVRVGQFNSQTTRLVIELAPGYVVDPQQIKIRGISPTQWTVDLPAPQRLPQNQLPPPVNSPTPQSNTPFLPNARNSSFNEAVQITRNGFYIPLDRMGNNSTIKKKQKRVKNDKFLEFTLPGAVLPGQAGDGNISLNQYGIGEIQLDQSKSSPPEAKITLQLAKNSPDWDALYSRVGEGGLVLLPRGGIAQFDRINPPTSIAVSNPPPSQPVAQTQQLATISRVELTQGDRQLIVRSDRPVRGQGRWDSESGVYEIRIPNARLANPVQGPQLTKNSAIYQLRIRQETPTMVVLLVQPSTGVKFGTLVQPNSNQLALNIQPLRGYATAPRPINVPPPLNNNFPRTATSPTPYNPPRTGLLVVIDPGHGGKDPGAIGLGGLQEKDVILPISLDVAKYLERQGVRVLLTRNSDYFVSLQGRTVMANQAQANLFVSIHANSMGKGRPDVSGLEVYYYGNSGLAKAIHRSILRTVNIRDRGVRRARFYVLRHSKMPATLVEVGFVTGNEDSAKLSNSAYRSQMAQAIGRGILEYIQQNRM